MDGYVAQQAVAAFNGDEGQQFDEQTEQEIYSDGYGLETIRNVDGSSGNEMRHSIDGNPHRDSSAGKLFVGGIAWETSSETFTSYFSKYGEILDSIIMMDKITGRPRGFGFVTFADPSVADKVLEEEHVIDGRTVEVKRTVPRDDMRPKGVLRTRKIFVGGLPISLTEDEFREYFSSYGNILEHQIMVDHDTGRSRGFGFVTFEAEEAVDVILSDGQMHELGGKQVEIKRAEPKRVGADDRQWLHGGGSGRPYGVFGGGAAAYGGGYGGKMGRGYGGFGGYNSSGYANFGNYGGDSSGFFAGYGGYGYGFGFGGAAMYGGAGYGAGGYGAPAGYGGGGVYGGSGGGVYGGSKGFGGGGGGYGSGKGYSGSGGVGGGRHHPYRK